MVQTEKLKKAIAKASTELDSQSFRKKVLNELRSVFPFTAACFTTVDPNTLLSTGAVTDDCIESIHSLLFENEYLTDDFNQYVNLVKQSERVATLSLSTGGHLERSARYRDILLPAGFADELRAALVYKGKCWGFLTLFRTAEQSTFGLKDIEFVSSFIPLFAQSLRDSFVHVPAHSHKQLLEPGIIIVSSKLELLSSNRVANEWLSLLRKWEQIEANVMPRPIRAVCLRAKANTERIGTPLANVCIRTPNGLFLSIRASELSSFSSMEYAIMLELAKPQEVLALMIDCYGLSLREKQLLERLLRGYSTKELAESLAISTYTVQDHLKSIFTKTSVNSRRELIWLMLSQYSLPYTEQEAFI
jgi:DNA-binding CsgD family transcriptional regulator